MKLLFERNCRNHLQFAIYHLSFYHQVQILYMWFHISVALQYVQIYTILSSFHQFKWFYHPWIGYHVVSLSEIYPGHVSVDFPFLIVFNDCFTYEKLVFCIDEIPNCILRDCAHELAPPIAHIINLLLKSAQRAEDLKTAKITPIFKDGEKSKYTIHRPISVLPAISKILERCVYNQLICHLQSHNILSSQQYGFL